MPYIPYSNICKGEREPHIQVDRSLLFSKIAYDTLTPKGCKMINALDVTAAFAYDTDGQVRYVIKCQCQSGVWPCFLQSVLSFHLRNTGGRLTHRRAAHQGDRDQILSPFVPRSCIAKRIGLEKLADLSTVCFHLHDPYCAAFIISARV